jgi:hypothetical protein
MPKEKPDHKGAYTLKGIEPMLWRQVKAAAALKGQTINEWLLDTIRRAVKGGGKS